MLLRLRDRAKGYGGAGEAWEDEEGRFREERALARRFRDVASFPSLKFECSMLQTPVVQKDGRVAWREVRCSGTDSAGPSAGVVGDPDDFEMLWNPEWRVGRDVAEDDAVLLLPAERPEEWAEPADLARARERADALDAELADMLDREAQQRASFEHTLAELGAANQRLARAEERERLLLEQLEEANGALSNHGGDYTDHDHRGDYADQHRESRDGAAKSAEAVSE